MPAHGFVERLAELSASGVPFVCVTLVEAVGSTPDAFRALLQKDLAKWTRVAREANVKAE